MAPIASPPVPQQAQQAIPADLSSSDQASTLELSLLTLALLTSAVLSLIPSTHARVQNNGGRPSFFITVFSIVFAVLALAISAVALAFGWSRTISIDALATVVFGLIPALLSMPLGNIEYAWFRIRMARFKSLSLTYGTFTYVTFDEPCQMPIRLAMSRSPLAFSYPVSPQPILYIRHFPQRKGILNRQWRNKYIHCTLPAAKAHSKKSYREGAPVFNQHRGRCLEHHKHFLVLQNFNRVSEMRWFRSVSSSTSIIARPWLVYLNTASSSYQALALLSDIISMGRLVLKHRLGYVKHQVIKSEAMRKEMRRTRGMVCRKILEHVGLTEWGFGEREVFANDLMFPSERCKRYGLLFAVMTINSGIYGEKYHGIDGPSAILERTRARKGLFGKGTCGWNTEETGATDMALLERVSAQSVLEQLRGFEGSRDGFLELERNEVDRWLISWGSNPKE